MCVYGTEEGALYIILIENTSHFLWILYYDWVVNRLRIYTSTEREWWNNKILLAPDKEHGLKMSFIQKLKVICSLVQNEHKTAITAILASELHSFSIGGREEERIGGRQFHSGMPQRD